MKFSWSGKVPQEIYSMYITKRNIITNMIHAVKESSFSELEWCNTLWEHAFLSSRHRCPKPFKIYFRTITILQSAEIIHFQWNAAQLIAWNTLFNSLQRNSDIQIICYFLRVIATNLKTTCDLTYGFSLWNLQCFHSPHSLSFQGTLFLFSCLLCNFLHQSVSCSRLSTAMIQITISLLL